MYYEATKYYTIIFPEAVLAGFEKANCVHYQDVDVVHEMLKYNNSIVSGEKISLFFPLNLSEPTFMYEGWVFPLSFLVELAIPQNILK